MYHQRLAFFLFFKGIYFKHVSHVYSVPMTTFLLHEKCGIRNALIGAGDINCSLPEQNLPVLVSCVATASVLTP